MCRDLCCHLVPRLPWSFGHAQFLFVRLSSVLYGMLVSCMYEDFCSWILFHNNILSFQELRSGYHLISEFCCEGSTMTADGAFSTAWLKNLQKPMGSLVLSQDIGSRNNCNPFLFFTQPSSIPGSVMQLVGSSYLHRATAWEIYGRWNLTSTSYIFFCSLLHCLRLSSFDLSFLILAWQFVPCLCIFSCHN